MDPRRGRAEQNVDNVHNIESGCGHDEEKQITTGRDELFTAILRHYSKIMMHMFNVLLAP